MNLGKILEIDENIDGFEWGGIKSWTGYRVKTTKGVYLVVVSDLQDCCESYGSEHHIDDGGEDLSYFIGSDLVAVLTDGTPHNIGIHTDYIPDTHSMFVDFKTTKGVFTLTCYNAHNGHYAHEAGVYFRSLNGTETMELLGVEL